MTKLERSLTNKISKKDIAIIKNDKLYIFSFDFDRAISISGNIDIEKIYNEATKKINEYMSKNKTRNEIYKQKLNFLKTTNTNFDELMGYTKDFEFTSRCIFSLNSEKTQQIKSLIKTNSEKNKLIIYSDGYGKFYILPIRKQRKDDYKYYIPYSYLLGYTHIPKVIMLANNNNLYDIFNIALDGISIELRAQKTTEKFYQYNIIKSELYGQSNFEGVEIKAKVLLRKNDIDNFKAIERDFKEYSKYKNDFELFLQLGAK